MTKNDLDLREILKEAHAYFFLLKGEQTIRLRLWEILTDSIVIDLPKGAPMRKTILGLIPTIDGSAVYEVEGFLGGKPLPNQMPDTLRLKVNAGEIKKVNRRLYPRVSFTPPLDAVVVQEGEEKETAARIINLSAGGLRIETLEELPPEKELTFKFEIECDEAIHVLAPTGTIVYELPSDAGHEYGVRFGRDEDDTLKEGEERSVDTIERTVDLIALVNKLIVRQ